MSIFDAFEPILLWLIQNVFDPLRICHLINSGSVLWSIQDLFYDPFKKSQFDSFRIFLIHSETPSLIHLNLSFFDPFSLPLFDPFRICALIHSESVLWSIQNLFDTFWVCLSSIQNVLWSIENLWSIQFVLLWYIQSMSFDPFRIYHLIYSGSVLVWSIQRMSFDPFKIYPSLALSEFVLVWYIPIMSFDLYRIYPSLIHPICHYWIYSESRSFSILSEYMSLFDPFRISFSLIHSESNFYPIRKDLQNNPEVISISFWCLDMWSISEVNTLQQNNL